MSTTKMTRRPIKIQIYGTVHYISCTSAQTGEYVRSNDPCSAAMRPCVKVLGPTVYFSSRCCFVVWQIVTADVISDRHWWNITPRTAQAAICSVHRSATLRDSTSAMNPQRCRRRRRGRFFVVDTSSTLRSSRTVLWPAASARWPVSKDGLRPT